MGAAWCRDRAAAAHNSKSPLDRVIVQCVNQIYPNTERRPRAPENHNSIEVDRTKNRPYVGYPVPVHTRHRPISATHALNRSSQWEDASLRVPDSSDESIPPVPPPRKKKLMREQLNQNQQSESWKCVPRPPPPQPPTTNTSQLGMVIATSKGNKKRRQKTLSTVSLPNYNDLSLTVYTPGSTEKPASGQKSPPKNESCVSLPGKSSGLSSLSEATVEKIENCVRRCRSFGAFKPEPLKIKDEPVNARHSSESDDSFDGLDDWDLAVIEHCEAHEISPPQTLLPPQRQRKIALSNEQFHTKFNEQTYERDKFLKKVTECNREKNHILSWPSIQLNAIDQNEKYILSSETEKHESQLKASNVISKEVNLNTTNNETEKEAVVTNGYAEVKLDNFESEMKNESDNIDTKTDGEILENNIATGVQESSEAPENTYESTFLLGKAPELPPRTHSKAIGKTSKLIESKNGIYKKRQHTLNEIPVGISITGNDSYTRTNSEVSNLTSSEESQDDVCAKSTLILHESNKPQNGSVVVYDFINSRQSSIDEKQINTLNETDIPTGLRTPPPTPENTKSKPKYMPENMDDQTTHSSLLRLLKEYQSADGKLEDSGAEQVLRELGVPSSLRNPLDHMPAVHKSANPSASRDSSGRSSMTPSLSELEAALSDLLEASVSKEDEEEANTSAVSLVTPVQQSIRVISPKPFTAFSNSFHPIQTSSGSKPISQHVQVAETSA